MTASVAAGLAERLKAQAYGVGFDLAGVVRLAPTPTYEHYQAWIAAERQGTMSYMARGTAGRSDPRLHLPQARSALVVAMNYGGMQTSGPIARYARGDDYHDVLLGKLRQLEQWLRSEASDDMWAHAYVDTGPFLERDLAQQAGLGWSGKNTMLINPKLGSFILLGTLFTSLELDADEPFVEDRCGTCTRCLEACPTSAIVAPHELDARLCISYLTIELRGAIPRQLRSAVGSLVFGCDICQDVCPWNVKFAHTAKEPALAPRLENVEPDLAELITLSDDDFRARFRKSAVKRSKRAGLARNAAVALGNRRDARDIPVLARVLSHDSDPIVRAHAAWALGRFTSHADARRALLAAAAIETDANVCAEINAALNDVGA